MSCQLVYFQTNDPCHYGEDLLEFGHGCGIDQLSKWEELPKCPVSFMQIAIFAVPLMQVVQVVHHFPTRLAGV